MNKSENKNVLIKEFFVAPKPKQTSSTAFRLSQIVRGRGTQANEQS